MAYWPRIVRDNPFRSLLIVVVTPMLALLIVALSGMTAWVVAAVLAVSCVALYVWLRLRARDAHARAAADPFSFGDVVLRMRAKERAQVLVAAARRQELLGPQ